jgi:DnaJ family protein A protein 2
MFFGGFEDFMGGGGGGHHHGHGGMPDLDDGPVDNDTYYELLGLERSNKPDAGQIRKAFRKMAMKHHPDKGGNVETFKKLQTAHEVLSDPEKKSLYDEDGEKGVERGGPPGGGMADLFGGGRRRGGGRPEKKKGEDFIYPIKVTLDKAYTGEKRVLRITKNKLCTGCDGAGGKNVRKCSGCKGQGVVLGIRRMGPMIQQVRMLCEDCQGSGETVKDKCTECRGAKVKKMKEVLEVFVERGAADKDKIRFRGQADEAPNTVPGDIVVKLNVLEHKEFTRIGKNLVYKKTISLADALCGVRFSLTHLDGRKLLVQTPEGQVISPGMHVKIADEGMPNLKTGSGVLIVKFDVKFPTYIDPNTLPTLRGALKANGSEPQNQVSEAEYAECEEVQIVKVNMDNETRRWRQERDEDKRTRMDDSDDEDQRGGGGQQQECRAQ